ncbi:MAG: hypothetical protein QMD13_04935 [Candidatus Bathyarchaeia archaeon]|nr:hypothetical protein [Candidatus Bathyarchaeia archaeon]
MQTLDVCLLKGKCEFQRMKRLGSNKTEVAVCRFDGECNQKLRVSAVAAATQTAKQLRGQLIRKHPFCLMRNLENL